MEVEKVDDHNQNELIKEPDSTYTEPSSSQTLLNIPNNEPATSEKSSLVSTNKFSLTSVANSRSVRTSRTQFNVVELFSKRALKRKASSSPKVKKRNTKVFFFNL